MKVCSPSPSHLRRFLRLSSGFLLLPLGVVMIILPGPGLPIVLLALGLLAGEFIWAQRLLTWVQRQVAKATQLLPPRLSRLRMTQVPLDDSAKKQAETSVQNHESQAEADR